MKILLTRPLEDSKKLAQYLTAIGLQPVIIPLLAINYYPADLSLIKQYDYILISSKHALFALENACCKDKTILVIGKNNYQFIQNQSSKIELLGENILEAKQYLRLINSKILYLAGEDLTDNLEDFSNINKIIVYKANFCIENEDKIKDFILNEEKKILSFFSLRTAEFFLEIIKKYNLQINLTNSYFVCFSKKIGALFFQENFKNVFWAQKPQIEIFIELLNDIQNGKKD